jgi:hypothetical protein
MIPKFNPQPSPRSIHLNISFPNPLLPSNLQSLVDTGATDSFVGSDFVKEYNLSPIKLSEPIQLSLFDGRSPSAGPVTHFVNLEFSSNISGLTQHHFLITKLPATQPVVLGFDFLRTFDPEIDWTHGTLRRKSANPPSTALFTNNKPESHARSSNSGSTSNPSSIANLSSTSNLATAGFFDDDEDPDDIKDILRLVPSEYHDFVNVFSKSRADKLPPHRPYDHAIELEGDSLPRTGPIYSTSSKESEILKSNIDELLSKGFIRPSKSPVGAPVVFAKKKDGTLRLCIDYRQLNSRTRKDRYPIPPISTLLAKLSAAKIFTKIDLRGAYNLLRIVEGDEWKTAFRTRYGSFEFLVMPFGLTNARASFQHFVNDVFHQHVDNFVIVYLDDILVYSNTLEEHRQHVRTVLELLRDNGLYGKATKCEFHTTSIEYLGYFVTPQGLEMDPAKVRSILDWPIPTSIKGVQSFLGFANFYRRFIQDYSKVANPLTSLIKKDLPFKWGEPQQEAFELLKTRFTAALILAHFDPSLPTFVETDASDYALGCILSQVGTDDLLHPVAFESRKMQPAELNYEIHDKELLAIHYAFTKWRSMLLSLDSQIVVLTDHTSLRYFMSSKLLNRRQARWAEFLSEFDFEVRYRPGKQGQKPDALSRRDDVYPRGGDGAYALNNPQNYRPLLKQAELRLATTELRPATLFANLTANLPVMDSEGLRQRMQQAQLADDKIVQLRTDLPDGYTLDTDDVLLFDSRIFVPENDSIKLDILRSRHDHPLAGHPGRTKTLQLVRRDFYWPKAADFVQRYVAGCVPCARNKSSRSRPGLGLLQHRIV